MATDDNFDAEVLARAAADTAHAAVKAASDTLGHIKSSASIAVNASTGAATVVVAGAIDAAPAYVGQIAVAGGKAYVALAVSSASDWQEIAAPTG